ncbi:MAG: thymidine phosphorylase [Acidobacteriota bacterium]|nr:thymidine phosphorylase [Acidobacteriota bacterium]
MDLIRRKRDGHEHSREEIEHLVHSYTVGHLPDHQAAAWLMAAHLRGLSRAETAHLTDAMLHSGEVLDFSSLSARKVDKHSTGGVGDKTSLVLAPLAAAGGLIVPMISGRGLGHTGGTLDKLEAIPGLSVKLSSAEFRRVLEECGCAIISQTEELVPADRKLYQLRNFTGTVESPSLICASIMSKKLAEGIDALVLDVKTGSGAFMKREEDAVHLAELMVETARRMGVRAVALLTNMDQPLGTHIGNALEVQEALEVLRGRGPGDLRTLSLEFAAWMFYLGERTANLDEGRRLAAELIASGAGLEKFRHMVRLQGGDHKVADDHTRMPQARYQATVKSPRSGYIAQIHCEHMGTASVLLGGGRVEAEDAVDHAVGIVLHKKVGDRVGKGEALCTVHYNSEERLWGANLLIEDSYHIADTAPVPTPLVHRVITDV